MKISTKTEIIEILRFLQVVAALFFIIVVFIFLLNNDFSSYLISFQNFGTVEKDSLAPFWITGFQVFIVSLLPLVGISKITEWLSNSIYIEEKKLQDKLESKKLSSNLYLKR